MSNLQYLFNRVFYKSIDLFLDFEPIPLPEELVSQKNLFIYFDYEREFGGHPTQITDKHIYKILDALDLIKIQATWFTVGKIFDKYPSTIEEILLRGHEIGSHTYNHIAPLNSNRKQLTIDFSDYHSIAKRFVKLNGFHSPNGRWDKKTLNLLKRYGYQYDLVSRKKGDELKKSVLFSPRYQLIRFVSLGDDWGLRKQSAGVRDVADYFLHNASLLQAGEVAGIGAHPWLLVENDAYLSGFITFLKELVLIQKYNIKTASGFCKIIQQSDWISK